MRSTKWLLVTVPLFALALGAGPPKATACGACIVAENVNTQVTSHRMIFSISPAETTLWDQISYSGDPASFAWVLPVKGTVDVGLSSDGLFDTLDQYTRVTISPPPLDCPDPPSSCYDDYYEEDGTGAAGTGGAGGGGGGGVYVVAHSVVGPYETVTLHSTDSNALSNWLTGHGYAIQPDFAPVVATYVAEGFDFLALKLVPGAGVSAMKPVRVTTPGAGAVLPLRMVAGGTGATTPITLWVVGEGRYEPQNFPSFTIPGKSVTWDFSTASSNYATLRQKFFSEAQGRTWQTEVSRKYWTEGLRWQIDYLVADDPVSSGYGDEMGNGAQMEFDDDFQHLVGSVGNPVRITRLYAELPRAALDTDLVLGASMNQLQVPGSLRAGIGINPPPCPTYEWCEDSETSGTSGGKGCMIGRENERSAALGALLVALGAGLVRRRSARRRG